MGEKYLITDKSHSPLLPLKNEPYCLPFPDISKYVKKLKKSAIINIFLQDSKVDFPIFENIFDSSIKKFFSSKF